jgi:hypothetical protein
LNPATDCGYAFTWWLLCICKREEEFVLFCAEGRKSFIFVRVLASINLSFKLSLLRDCQMILGQVLLEFAMSNDIRR